eukprot:gene39061-47522_t
MIAVALLLFFLFLGVDSFRGLNWKRSSTSLSALQADESALSSREVAQKSANFFLKASFAALSGISLSSRAAYAGLQYLTDPTEEFKEQEARSKAFDAAKSKVRQQWDSIMSRFEGTENPEELAKALRDMKKFISDTNDIPVGVSKRSLVKTCRSKKFISPKSRKTKTFWTTQVEIEYQGLIQEFNRKLNPVNVGDGL